MSWSTDLGRQAREEEQSLALSSFLDAVLYVHDREPRRAKEEILKLKRFSVKTKGDSYFTRIEIYRGSKNIFSYDTSHHYNEPRYDVVD